MSLNDLPQIRVGIPAVNDDRTPELLRQFQLPYEHLLLDLAWGSVVVVVQSDLADGNYPRVLQQTAQDFEMVFLGLDGIVGMNSCRGVNPVVPGGDGRGRRQVFDAGTTAHREDVRHSGRPGTFDDLFAVGIEIGIVEMGVGIDEELSH
jgi:hypothetical protein